jgi:hypothetical protein
VYVEENFGLLHRDILIEATGIGEPVEAIDLVVDQEGAEDGNQTS